MSLNCWHNSPASSREPPPQQEVESDAAALNRKFANSPACRASRRSVCYHIYFMLYTVHRCTRVKTLQRLSSRMLNEASTRGSRSLSHRTPPAPVPPACCLCRTHLSLDTFSIYHHHIISTADTIAPPIVVLALFFTVVAAASLRDCKSERKISLVRPCQLRSAAGREAAL